MQHCVLEHSKKKVHSCHTSCLIVLDSRFLTFRLVPKLTYGKRMYTKTKRPDSMICKEISQECLHQIRCSAALGRLFLTRGVCDGNLLAITRAQSSIGRIQSPARDNVVDFYGELVFADST